VAILTLVLDEVEWSISHSGMQWIGATRVPETSVDAVT